MVASFVAVDTGVFARSQELVSVPVEREIDLIMELQSMVCADLAQRGVAIEINPASNLLIGNLGDLTKHPLWRICPPVGRTPEPSLRVCVGSDDPITFATRLPEEYQLLWDALVDAGLSSRDADEWLDRARTTGLAVRFTTSRSRLPLKSNLGWTRMAMVP